jgi:hypothetical protein
LKLSGERVSAVSTFQVKSITAPATTLYTVYYDPSKRITLYTKNIYRHYKNGESEKTKFTTGTTKYPKDVYPAGSTNDKFDNLYKQVSESCGLY